MFFSGVSFHDSYSFLHSFMTLKNDDDEQNQKRAKEMERYPCSCTGIVKMPVLPRLICRFKAIPIKIPAVFCTY